MTSKNLKFIKLAEKLYGKKAVSNALDAVTQDIKFNRINFNKKTYSKEFMNIFYASLRICLEVY